MKEAKKRLIVLDSHAILHRAYHALPDFVSAQGEPTGGLYGLSTMLLKIITDLKPDYVIAAYDLPKPTYRHEAFKDYKAGRTKTDDALISQIKRSRAVFEAFSIPIYDKEGFEADDIIGTIVEKTKKQKDLEVVIASGDMDTLQLVSDKKVQVYTLKKGINDTILYDEDAVRARFGFGPELLPDYKGLRGDPSDNIPGIKGIGEVTATALITTFGSVEGIYKALKKDKAAFEKAGIKERIVELLKAGEEEAQFSKMLGTIRRDAPIEFALPEKVWRDTVRIEAIEELFRELDFRTLGARAKDVLAGKAPVTLAKEKAAAKEAQAALPAADPEVAARLGLMLWLLNSNITDPTFEDVRAFARTDDPAKAEELLIKEIENRKLTRVWEEIERPLLPLVARMQKRGIKIDTKFLGELGKTYHKELSRLEGEIWKLAGEEFNVASPKQLGEILFVKLGLAGKRQKKTSTGAFSTKESELEKLREIHPIIGLILEYRELAKLLGTYIDTIPKLVGPDGRLHARPILAGSTTGRMASEDPNIQNIPNKSGLGRAVRRAFIAEKGFKLVAFDYSQIELRIAAFLSGDKELIRIFREGLDVHTAVASTVFSLPPEQVTKDMRRQAKVINFGVMYGMGVTSLRQNLAAGGLTISREEAQTFYNGYFEKFSGLAKYLEETKNLAARQGYTETFFGRRRYFEGIKSKLPFIRAAAERMAINAPIQGTEADIIKLAMSRAEDFLAKEKLVDQVYLLMQVHDELVYEIAESAVAAVAPRIREIMESVIDPKEVSGIICKTDISVGDNWEEMAPLEATSK
jgi:DNA polymerase I